MDDGPDHEKALVLAAARPALDRLRTVMLFRCLFPPSAALLLLRSHNTIP
jgi:hypothetical protein